MEKIKIRWVIAHEPAYLFYRVAKDFEQQVNQRSTNTKIDIEILTASEYNNLYQPNQEVNRNNLWKLLQDNTIQITQMTTTSLGSQCNRQLHAFDMPYLFKDHDHAANILEGEIGEYLLNSFDPSSKLKGLAYTYSGGFRLMPFKGSVTSLGEIAGANIRSGKSPVAQDTIRSFGFNPVPTEIDEVSQAIAADQAVGAEHVAQRLWPDNCDKWINTIVDTEHSLFLTSIVVNVDWWNSLGKDLQNIFMESAKIAARNERQLSIEDGHRSIEKLQRQGVKVIKLSEQEKDDLKSKVQHVYEKYDGTYFEPGLISKIKK
jgi:TRAP-type C4-dicarboxylate transport system substrate-binding protein